jgi:hypothetical protein
MERLAPRVFLPGPRDARLALVEFHPADPPAMAALYGDVAACDLIPVLRALLTRLEAGTLRMPVGHGHRWVDVPEGL